MNSTTGIGKARTVGKLTSKAGGNVMFSETELHFANEFVEDNIGDIPEDKATLYRRYRENLASSAKKKKQLETVHRVNEKMQHPFGMLPDRETRYREKIPRGGPLPPGPGEMEIGVPKWIERKRKVFIDTEFRDKIAYPDSSDFVVSWGTTFQNVKSMRLVSLEFPNVVQSIRAGVNSSIRWINLEDIDLDPPFPVYSIDANSGSYTLGTLQTELTAKMKVLKRHGGLTEPNKPPVRHSIIVETNEDTDYVGFTSIIARASGNNPVTVVSGSNIAYFRQKDHGYMDAERIHIIGVMGIIGGLQASDINGAYTITKIDNDTFSFELQGVAQLSGVGGGTLVRSGREAPFQFLFGEDPTSIADIIGFPSENSSVPVPEIDPLTSIIRPIIGVIPGDMLTQIVAPDHKLLQGDRVFLHNVHISPSIYENEKSKGIFTVFAVPSPDVFTINYSTERVSDITNAFVGTQILEMYYPNHGFNRIVDISQMGENTVSVTTLFDHGMSEILKNTQVRITGSNCVPSIDGYWVVTPTGEDSFTISNPEDQDEEDPLPLLLQSPGHKGILTSDHNFFLYNVSEFGGFTAPDLNNTLFTVREIIDADNFLFQGHYGFSKRAETGGGSGIRINSKLHGWSGTQNNHLLGTLFKPVTLAGENYAFMCVPGLNSDSISTNTPVKNIFAKLFITTNPGQVIFTQFDSSPIDFAKPIPTVGELRFTIKSPHNETISFNGLDYSFGFEVIEMVQVERGTGA
jgi:hypothetical protein